MSETVAENLKRVRERIEAACVRASRSASDVRLVAVSKTKPIEMVREAYAAGQSLFGENYAQEAIDKIGQLPDAEWHFIGSLQTNKAKQVAGNFAFIHSVDRVKLATALNSAIESRSSNQSNVNVNVNIDGNINGNVLTSHVPQPILLQVHIGDEETKHGFAVSDLADAAKQISLLQNLSIRGLMALPPLEESEAKSRVHFAKVREALEIVKAALPLEQSALVRELSMGTSGDLAAAILEGATLVRVGTDIFGAR